MTTPLKFTAAIAALFTIINATSAAALDVGAVAPALNVTIQTGDTIDLGNVFSEGITLVFFYPKADTPGCTKQACSLRDSFEELTSKGVNVFGVSYDSPENQRKFIEKYSLPFNLISDQKKTLSKAFGRKWMSRQAYLIQEGKIIWRDTKASTQTQAADVKQALSDLHIMTFDSLGGN